MVGNGVIVLRRTPVESRNTSGRWVATGGDIQGVMLELAGGLTLVRKIAEIELYC